MNRPVRTLPLAAVILLSGLVAGVSAQDQGAFGKVIRIDREAFQPDAGMITFSEFPLGTTDPAYLPEYYGGMAGGVTVTFGGFFAGQAIASRAECPPGAVSTGCVAGTPVAPLKLDQTAPVTFVAEDGSNPRSPSLSGSPRFNGPISMLFDVDVAGVGLAGGYFNALEATAILAFDRNGRLIGGVRNIELGMEYMALVTEDGANRIAGLQFALVGNEMAGFGIDDLTVARIEQMDQSQIPGFEAMAPAAPPAEAPSLLDLAPGTPSATPPKDTPSLKDLLK
jgi:hypothetical protein